MHLPFYRAPAINGNTIRKFPKDSTVSPSSKSSHPYDRSDTTDCSDTAESSAVSDSSAESDSDEEWNEKPAEEEHFAKETFRPATESEQKREEELGDKEKEEEEREEEEYWRFVQLSQEHRHQLTKSKNRESQGK